MKVSICGKVGKWFMCDKDDTDFIFQSFFFSVYFSVWHMKNQNISACKIAYLQNDIIIYIIFNPFQANVQFLYPLKYSFYTSGFLTFSGGIEIKHWLKMG